MIESEQLDWRTNYNVPMRPWSVPEELQYRIQRVLGILGLKMGIMDLKLDTTGEPVFLEVNSQGQFLFIEGLSGLELTSRFVEFLYRQADYASAG